MTAETERSREGGAATAGPLGRTVVALALAAWIALGLLPLTTPAPLGRDAPATEFSAARAAAQQAVLARAPHPVGSAEHARVQADLVAELEHLGLAPRVERRLAERRSRRGALRLARVENVLARLPGSRGGGKAILLVAHYDSVPTGPGASDDGSGVATLLETLRALAAGPRLDNDVLALFSDGEELGLLGAAAFVAADPWARDVGLVLNFEARGTRGPVVMFETGPADAALMRAFGGAAPAPVAYSYSADVYRFLPNDTDFSVLARLGQPGFNFAFIGGLEGYHTRLDTVARADLGSLQHDGSYALSLVRRFGGADLGALGRGGEAVYFTLPGRRLAVYPASWALPLAVFAVALFLLLAYLGLRRRSFHLGGLLLGSLAAIAALGAATLAVVFCDRLLVVAFHLSPAKLGGAELYVAGWAAVGAGAAWTVLAAFARRLGILALGAGTALVWVGLAVASAVVLPASSFLFLWPLLAILAALLWLARRPGGAVAPPLVTAVLAIATAPALLLWAPSASLLATAFGPGAGVVLAGVSALVAGLLASPLALVAGTRRPLLAPLGVVAAGLLVAVLAASRAGYTSERPRPDSLLYLREGGSAWWASFDRAPDPWVAGKLAGARTTLPAATFFADFPGGLTAAAAATVAGPLPQATLRGEEPAGGGRRLTLLVSPPEGASALELRLRSAARITALSVDGRAVDPPAGEGFQALYFAPPAAGFPVEVTLSGTAPLEVALVGRSYGFPPPIEGPGPRPPEAMPSPHRPTDLTLVRASATF